MYEHLKGKKLLIIGSALEEGMVDVAHEMGIFTIVCDNVLDRKIARAKVTSDLAWDLDYNDTKEIVRRCREIGVDGVFAGYGEFRVLAACRIAKELGTPFYATEEQVLMTADKRAFRNACEKFGIPVPKNYAGSKGMSEEEKAQIQYPVIVKPSDRSGRIGISICANREELDHAIDYAVNMSESGTFVAESYLVGTEFTAIYTMVKGKASLSCVDAKYITDDQRKSNFLCDCSIAPAYFVDQIEAELSEKIAAFMKELGVTDGMANFQGMLTESGVYLFEMGLRLNGNNDWRFIEKANGISFLKMMIAYSLCGDMCDDLSKDNPHFGEYFCTLPFYAHEGVIARMETEEIFAQDWVEVSTMNASVGSVMKDDGTSRQKVAAFLIRADSFESVKERIHFIQEKFIVEDADGNNMLFTPFNTDKLVRSI